MRLPLLLDMVADAFGDRVLVGPREGGLTAAELRARVDTAAADLIASGADSVVYLALNGPALPVALFAAARAGLPLVPVNYRLGKEQLDALLTNHPKAFGIAEGAEAEAALDRAGISHTNPADWLAGLPLRPADAPVPLDEDAPAVVIYTSGTTSAPKGVLLRHANLVSYVLGTVEFGSADEADAALVSVPPYHIA
ncbi:MAG: AMP-binding protein, partial [Mycobacteriales bacterium]